MPCDEIIPVSGSAARNMGFVKASVKLYAQLVVVVVVYPTPSEGWGHGGRPWSPRSRATPQGLDQRS